MIAIYLSIAGLLLAAYGLQSYRAFVSNRAAAQQTGLPYICLPFYTFNPFWLVTHRLWLPFLRKLPRSVTHPWIEYSTPDFPWHKLHDGFKEIGGDVVLLVAPGKTQVLVADADVCTQIVTRRNDFPKPTEIYRNVDLFGKNVVTTEGMLWRHHRKITSPPFTERNNAIVWEESLQQAQSMMTGWMGKGVESSGRLQNVASEAMRLSLHVISRAGFGVRLLWPHEESSKQIPPGHTLTYKDALSGLLENIVTVMLIPKWFLRNSPFQSHKVANEAYVEWGRYMREMYNDKVDEVKKGGAKEDGLDLMGALVKGAGITADDDKPSSPSKQFLTDDEILGNAFVFILAGHETAANTIHFSILYLAMHWSSQHRLQQDLDAIFGDRPISAWNYDDDVPRLFGSMCGAVMNEELRLIPPVLGIPKSIPRNKPPQGLQVGGTSVSLPPGCSITLSAAAMHRNPRYWPHTSPEDLSEFRPERWLLDPSNTTTTSSSSDSTQHVYGAEDEGLDFEGPDKRPDTAPSLFRPARGAYIPFSEGWRSCLGRRFAQVEILAVLAVIFKHYSVELDVGQYLSDAEVEAATEEEKRAAWDQAEARGRWLLKNGMMTIITIQMRGEKVPLRFVKRGAERFKFN